MKTDGNGSRAGWPKLFIFDVGGVMVDGFNVMPRVADELEMSPEDLKRLMVDVGVVELSRGEITERELWQRVQRRTDKNVREDLLGAYFQPSRYQPMYELVSWLQECGYRVVAGTNTFLIHYEIHQKQGDYDIFNKVYASHELGSAKPEHRFYQLILEREGAAPGDAVFVDDFTRNVAAAEAVGLIGVHHVSIGETTSEVERLLAGREKVGCGDR